MIYIWVFWGEVPNFLQNLYTKLINVFFSFTCRLPFGKLGPNHIAYQLNTLKLMWLKYVWQRATKLK